MSLVSLYRLGGLFRDVELALINSDGEVTPDIEKMLEELQTQKTDKLAAIACLMKNADAEAEACKREEGRLKSRRYLAEARLNKLSELVQKLLPYEEEFCDGVHKMSYRESKAVEVVDQTKVPRDYIRVKTTEEVDKTKASAAFKAGTEAEIPGLQFITRYNLQVK